MGTHSSTKIIKNKFIAIIN